MKMAGYNHYLLSSGPEERKVCYKLCLDYLDLALLPMNKMLNRYTGDCGRPWNDVSEFENGLKKNTGFCDKCNLPVPRPGAIEPGIMSKIAVEQQRVFNNESFVMKGLKHNHESELVNTCSLLPHRENNDTKANGFTDLRQTDKETSKPEKKKKAKQSKKVKKAKKNKVKNVAIAMARLKEKSEGNGPRDYYDIVTRDMVPEYGGVLWKTAAVQKLKEKMKNESENCGNDNCVPCDSAIMKGFDHQHENNAMKANDFGDHKSAVHCFRPNDALTPKAVENNNNTADQKEKSCNICNVSVPDNNITEHRNGIIHKEKITMLINEAFSKNSCNFCKVTVTHPEIAIAHLEEHINGMKHTTEFIKSVTDKTNKYCNICNIRYSGNNVIPHKGRTHKKKINMLINEAFSGNLCNLCKVTVTQPQTTTDHLEQHINGMKHATELNKKPVADKTDIIYCNICNVPVSGNNITKHRKGETHKKKLYMSIEEAFSGNCIFCEAIVPQSRATISHLEQHINGMKHTKKFIEKSLEEKKEKYCKICNVSLLDENVTEHNNGRSHKKKINMLIREAFSGNSCNFCKVTVTQPQTSTAHLKEHITGMKHTTEFNKKSVADKKDIIDCDICNVRVPDNNITEHINGRTHKENLHILIKEAFSGDYCNICKVTVTQPKTTTAHLEEHINGIKHTIEFNDKWLKDKKEKCSICNVQISDKTETQHYNGRTHKKIINMLIKKSFSGNCCNICKVTVTQPQTNTAHLEDHINGMKHTAAAAAAFKLVICSRDDEL